MNESMTRPARRVRPLLESLEGRTLQAASVTAAATAVPANARQLNRENGISVEDRRMSYTTPQGTRVIVTLYGVGSLAGSTVDPDGALNLIFSQTGPQSAIVAKVSGGTRRATLRSIHHKDLNPDDLSGIGSSLLNLVNFKDFDLVNNGRINLTGGVHSLYLNSVGRNTQINLREEPVEFLTNTSSSLPTSTSSNGVDLAFITNLLGASTLTSVGGQFVSDFNSIARNTPSGGSSTIGVNPGPPPAPPGVVAVINHIKGAPRSTAGIEDPQVFGLDSTTHTLIRFDATTGAVLQTIPLTGMGPPNTGVALGRNAGRLVALVGDDTSIRAFDAVTGDPVGQFTTANLGSLGLTAIDGIGSTDTRTVISDSTAGAGGLALQIDVTASLATGHAVAAGQPFAPTRQFELSGGLASVPASQTMYATGAAHFDSFQPNLLQYGVLALNTAGNQLSETARTPFKVSGNFVNAGPEGSVDSLPQQVLGSVDQNLALITGVANGKNVVSLLSPQTLASNGTFTLNNPNPLTGLSESFRPDLANSALIDVQGNVQSLRAKDATGLVFNVAGYINLAKIKRASDSVLIGQPFGHAEIPKRSNVAIISSPRPVDDRNGVQVINNLKQIGPLTLPGR
ncbi:YncE family protein [Singulisphaera acidiphila]|uniref:DUF4394 domain-containing protein n=1 Tax=Singulisphaera acidiphila (strain ATCC BAA-1392 / DSM 18658 / VKM B-2454 / MOB10) TaxID=886293 RepID=L0DR80_SINAD|nr:hypothetical protein [Singulisphaera acidiphila]AGA31533.1 hypothetical protein Sinac_7499 [Singulisphaera acidiphila DSM 18658]